MTTTDTYTVTGYNQVLGKSVSQSFMSCQEAMDQCLLLKSYGYTRITVRRDLNEHDAAVLVLTVSLIAVPVLIVVWRVAVLCNW